MNGQLFRKKSMERISSPEQLNDYIRVSNPGIWMILAAIVILLAGVCIWGVIGHLDTEISAVAISRDGVMTVYVKEADIGSVEEDMKVFVRDTECTVTDIPGEAMAVDAEFSEYALHVGSLQIGEWVYEVAVSGKFADGVHTARIVTESVSPISFVVN